MMLPPVLLRVERRRAGGPGLRLWIPLIVLWPLVVLLAVLAVAILLVLQVFLRPCERARRYFSMTLRLLWLMYPLASSLRGAHLEFKDSAGRLLVKLV